MEIKAIKTRIFKRGENLLAFVIKYVPRLKNGDIVVITSKIVAYSEGRYVYPYTKNMRDKIIAEESSFTLRTKYTWLTIKDGAVMASAGVDESNADNMLILLPKDSFETAKIIRKEMMKYFGIKKIGVLITDSRLLPLRAGVVGVALGYAGFKGVRDYRGTPDLFGRKLKLSRTDVADSLATAAVLCMGEGKECQPLAIIRNGPVVFTDKINKKELFIEPSKDIYAPLFQSFIKNKKSHKKMCSFHGSVILLLISSCT